MLLNCWCHYYLRQFCFAILPVLSFACAILTRDHLFRFFKLWPHSLLHMYHDCKDIIILCNYIYNPCYNSTYSKSYWILSSVFSHDIQHLYSFTIKCVYKLNMMHVSIYLLKTNVSILIVLHSNEFTRWKLRLQNKAKSFHCKIKFLIRNTSTHKVNKSHIIRHSWL